MFGLFPGGSFSTLPEIVADGEQPGSPFNSTPLDAGRESSQGLEYLATGLPTQCTPLPEVTPSRQILIIESVDTARWRRR